jgi:hypothetical protein
MSKGSTPRPIPNREQYELNYDAIFGNERTLKYKKCEHCGQYWESENLSKNHECACPNPM